MIVVGSAETSASACSELFAYLLTQRVETRPHRPECGVFVRPEVLLWCQRWRLVELKLLPVANDGVPDLSAAVIRRWRLLVLPMTETMQHQGAIPRRKSSSWSVNRSYELWQVSLGSGIGLGTAIESLSSVIETQTPLESFAPFSLLTIGSQLCCELCMCSLLVSLFDFFINFFISVLAVDALGVQLWTHPFVPVDAPVRFDYGRTLHWQDVCRLLSVCCPLVVPDLPTLVDPFTDGSLGPFQSK